MSGKLKLLLLLLITAAVCQPSLVLSQLSQETNATERQESINNSNSSDRNNCLLVLQSLFADIAKELSTMTRPDQRGVIVSLTPKTESFLLACVSFCCNASQGSPPDNIILDWDCPSDAAAYITPDKKKMILINKVFFEYVVSAKTLNEVRCRHYLFLLVLAHELGHLNDQEYLNSNNYDRFVDDHASKFCSVLSLIALGLFVGSFLTENAYVSHGRNVAIGASAIAMIATMTRLYKHKQLEFTADEFMLKTFGYDAQIPNIVKQDFDADSQSKPSKSLIEKINNLLYNSVRNGYLNFLSDHPTDNARVQHLRDLIKKHQEETKSEQQKK